MTPKVFVSYRSTDANEVRPIVEVLRAHGVQVWFAEYEVLAGNYEDFEAALDAELERAISSCTHAMVCTNSSWVESPHCLHERDQLAARFGAGSSQIIHVEMPSHELGAETDQVLNGCPTTEHQPGCYSSTAKFVLARVAPEVEFVPPPQLRSGEGVTLSQFGYGVRLALGQYQYRTVRTMQTYSAGQSGVFMRQFVGEFEGERLLLLVTLVPPTRLEADFSDTMEQTKGHREQYTALRQQALKWHTDEPQSERGLHLVMYQGQPRLGMTFLKQGSDGSLAWHRMYILHLREPGGRVQGELHLSFGMPCRGDDTFELRRFMSIVPSLDKIATGTEYLGWSLLRRFSPQAVLIAALFVFGCLGVLSTPSCQAWRQQLANGNFRALLTTNDLSAGERLLRSGAFEESIPRFDRAIEIDPESDKAFRLRSLAHTWSGDSARALEDADSAIELNSDEAENWTSRAVAYFAAGDFVASRSDWREVVQRIVADTREIDGRVEVIPQSGKEYAVANACAGLGAATLAIETPEARQFAVESLREAQRLSPNYEFSAWSQLRPELKRDLESVLSEISGGDSRLTVE